MVDGGDGLKIKTTVFTKDRPIMDTRLTALRHVHSTFLAPPWGTISECRERAEAVRLRVATAAGLLPKPERTPLNVRIFGRQAADGCTIDKVSFESRPGFLVTGNLYRPLRWRGQRPAVLCPHGHFNGGRLEHSDKASIPLRCMNLAAHGFVVFSYDMIGYNDSLQLPHPRSESGTPDFPWTRRASLYGINYFGLQLWNSMRAMDFLCSLPDVDTNRIGCTGASGGGTQTYFLGLMDPRVRAMAPACMLSAHFQGGCLCEEAPLLHLDGLSTLDVVAALAPRPVLLLSVTQDWTNQNPEYEFPAMRQIYAIYGAADAISNVHLDLPHNYGRAFREHATAFFLRRLANDDSVGDRLNEVERAVPSAKSMRLFPNNALPKKYLSGDRLLTKLHTQACADFEKPPRSTAALRDLRRGWAAALKETFSCSEPEAVSIGSPGPTHKEKGFSVFTRIIGRRDRSEQTPALWIIPDGATKRSPAALLLSEKGKAGVFRGGEPSPLLKSLLSRGVRVLAIDLLGSGETAGLLKHAPLSLNHRLYHVFNRSLLAHRVQETLCGLAALRLSDGARKPDLIGIGRGAVVALLARALAGPIGATLADLSGLQTEKADFWLGEMYHPGILRLDGLRGAVALGPSSPLTLVGAPKPLATYAKAISRLHGEKGFIILRKSL
jgi:hypothetical protein